MLLYPATSMANNSIPRVKKPYKSWLKDGVNGGPSSMDVLVGWLADPSNYQRWRGGGGGSGGGPMDTERIPKKLLLEEILAKMHEVGIEHRLPKDVASKISTLQSNYRAAREWMDVDGRRLGQEGASDRTVHEEVVKRFAYWDSLDPSFGRFRRSTATAPGTGRDPMSISSIMDRHHQEPSQGLRDDEEEDELDEDDDENNKGHLHSGGRPTTHRHSSHSSSRSSNSSNTDIRYNPHPSPYARRRRRYTNQHDEADSADGHDDHAARRMRRRNSNASISTASSTSSDAVPAHILKHPHPHPPGPTAAVAAAATTGTPSSSSSSSAAHNQPPLSVDSVLAESFIQINRDSEDATRQPSSQDMIEFLRDKQVDQEQLLIEKESRIRAKAELVKHLMEAGFSEEEIAEQLSLL